MEMKAQNLEETDLIWVNEISTTWKFPAEIEAFHDMITSSAIAVKETNNADDLDSKKSIFGAFPSMDQDSKAETETPVVPFIEKDDLQYSALSGANEIQFNGTKTVSNESTFSKHHSTFLMAAVLGGIILCAGIVRNLARLSGRNGNSYLASSDLTIYDIEHLNGLTDAPLFQNALTIEQVAVDTVTMKPLVKPAAKINFKKLVRVETNDYQVGLLGGINNLRLLVTNNSPYILESVAMELHYLNNNGDVLKSKTLTVKNIDAKSGKSLHVATQKQGIKVTCYITNIKVKPESEKLIHL
ncbi:MAG TPA: hypothetical protein VM010_05845 [Chitinophagaceae bacterium]|nr:hypothetical protein [Chitinophagaceae bacterium]